MHNPWVAEVWRMGTILFAALLVGWLVGQPMFFLLIAVSAYLAWHLYHLYRLERWYHKRKRFHPPQAGGIWGEVYYHIYQLQQRNRKRKRKLARMLSRFNESTSAMPDASVVLTAGNRIEWFNKAAREYLGLRPIQDVGQRIDNLIRYPRFVQYLQSGDFNQPLEMPSPMGGDYMFSIRVVPYAKQRRLLLVRDITRLKRLERVRQDFVANVSHELRTPLTVIAGYLENIGDAEDECTARWGRGIGQMQEQTRRMIRIVEDLLMLSRLEAEDREKRRVPVAVPAILTILRKEAEALSGEEGHHIELSCDSSLWLQGEEKVLYSVFSNLIFNAVRYTPGGGRIQIRWFRNDDGVYFEVEDSGIGISPQHIPRLVERFYRVDPGRSREHGGTGLGLAIVKHGLECHDAWLDIESQVGEGSVFRCIFPASLAIRHEQQQVLQQGEQ